MRTLFLFALVAVLAMNCVMGHFGGNSSLFGNSSHSGLNSTSPGGVWPWFWPFRWPLWGGRGPVILPPLPNSTISNSTLSNSTSVNSTTSV
ncbi:uncharacterized protein Dwil_GK27364 [Drosophila willistoni]|uniref:Uncharacterized protein n=1 Tax=Drosophila willistoni TaxID=7260 RepID=A0A0Q9WWE5_DROWI|nr:uncharacterized protein LOC26529366 [Drosophila willistoni]KRF97700.1 uncharacterized protein Dwil_GK27364 [Drosophila willistoni]